MTPKMKKALQTICLKGFFLPCAHERNRTFTPLRTADFESAASTNSATWAAGVLGYVFWVGSLIFEKLYQIQGAQPLTNNF